MDHEKAFDRTDKMNCGRSGSCMVIVESAYLLICDFNRDLYIWAVK